MLGRCSPRPHSAPNDPKGRTVKCLCARTANNLQVVVLKIALRGPVEVYDATRLVAQIHKGQSYCTLIFPH